VSEKSFATVDPDEFIARLQGAHAPIRDDRTRAADATRRIMRALTATSASRKALDPLVTQLLEIADRLDTHAQTSRYVPGGSLGLTPGDDLMVTHPLVGAANPIAPPIRMERSADGIRGRVTYGVSYEGLPGCLHGGFIAMGFDTTLIFAAVLAGHPGVTGSLSIRFLKTTPLHVGVVYDAAVTTIDGRRATVTGRLTDPDGNVCAEAEGVFVLVSPKRFTTPE
jgi:Thioesterase superfamily